MEYEKNLTLNTSQRKSKHNGTIQESMHVSETLVSYTCTAFTKIINFHNIFKSCYM